jgi:hypothetical protein
MRIVFKSFRKILDCGKITAMEKIQIEVNEAAEKTFSMLSAEGKKQLGIAVSVLLRKIENGKSETDYKTFLDKLSDEAVGKGLTEKLLQELLTSDD